MATTALKVVPLLAMRRELRIEGDTNPDDDARLIGQIGAAVSDVSLDASAPLVEQRETIEAAVPYRDRPVAFTATVVRAVRQVRYWTPGGSLRSAPDGVLTDEELGRLQSDWPATRRNRLYPPAAGWPAVLAGSRLWLDVTRGVPFLEWVAWPGAPPAADATQTDQDTYADAAAAYAVAVSSPLHGLRQAVILRVREHYNGDERRAGSMRNAYDALIDRWRRYDRG